MNKILIKYLKNFLFFLLLVFGMSQVTFSDDEQCQNECFVNNLDDIIDQCMNDHGDDYKELCLFDGGQYATITQYKDECFDMYGEDYAIVYNGDMFFMSVDDFANEVCDEYDFACKEDMKNEYSDAPYFDMDEAAEACIEDHWEDFGDDCLENYPGPVQLQCYIDHYNEYFDSCLDVYGTDEPSCGCDEDQVWIEEDGMCLGEDELACYRDGEHCKYDGVSWCSGYDATSLSGQYADKASDSCVSIDEALCLFSDGYYDGTDCINPSSNYAQDCIDNGGFWSYKILECLDSQEQQICLDDGNYWSVQKNKCYENEEEGTCEELGDEFVDGVCLSDEASECYRNGEQFYCEKTNSCVESEDACCDSEDNFVRSLGECIDNTNKAECLNNGNYWSDDFDTCYNSRDEIECLDEDNFWDEDSNICYSSESELDCEKYGNTWDNDKERCIIFESGNNNDNNKDSNGFISTNGGASINNEGSNVSLTQLSFKSSKYNPSSNNHNYISPATTTGNYYLYNAKSEVINLGNYDRATPGKFSPDGNKFIFGIYSFKFDHSNNDENDRRIYYDVLSFNKSHSTYLGKFNIVKNNAFYQHDYKNTLLLDWNNDHKIYFMSKGVNDEDGDFKVNFYDVGYNDNIFSSKRIEDLSKLFETKHLDVDSNLGIYQASSFFDPLKSRVNNVYEFNPVDSSKIIAATKSDSSTMNFPLASKFNLLSLSNGEIYYDLPKFNLDNPNPSIRLPNNDFYKYSNDGKFVLSFSDNSFKIVNTSVLYDLSINNDNNRQILYPNYLLERIIPINKLLSQKVTYFNFDNKVFGDDELPLGIFYSVYDSDLDKTELKYVSLKTGKYFTLYIIYGNYIDSIEVNPKKNELLVHSCDYDHPEEVTGSYYGNPENKRFLNCKLEDLRFNRKLKLFSSSVADFKISLNETFSTLFDFDVYDPIIPKVKLNYSENLNIDNILNDINLVLNSKELYQLLNNLDLSSDINVGVNLNDKNIQKKVNFQLEKELLNSNNLKLSCKDLVSFNNILSNVKNNNLLLANLWNLKNLNCKNLNILKLVSSLNCSDYQNIKFLIEDKYFIQRKGVVSKFKKVSNKKFKLNSNLSSQLNKISVSYNFNVANLMKERCKEVKVVSANEWFRTFAKFVFNGTNLKVKKSLNPNNSNLEYNNFLNFLRDNYIINIKGVRNDSSIQDLSVNLKLGQVEDGLNSDAGIEFIINQDVMEDIFNKRDNLGRAFFNKVVSGDIKMNKLDNKGVIEAVFDWFGDFFGDNKKLKKKENLKISCPKIKSEVCGENNKTYFNGCFANQDNVKIDYKGACLGISS